jgi:hypothetical protein
MKSGFKLKLKPVMVAAVMGETPMLSVNAEGGIVEMPVWVRTDLVEFCKAEADRLTRSACNEKFVGF